MYLTNSLLKISKIEKYLFEKVRIIISPRVIIHSHMSDVLVDYIRTIRFDHPLNQI